MELKRNSIYRYKDGENSPLGIYLCDTQAKGKIVVVPLTNKKSDDFCYKLSVTNQFAAIGRFCEIDKKDIISGLYLDSKLVKIPYCDISHIQHCIIHMMFGKIESMAHTSHSSVWIFESIYQFLSWKTEKWKLNFSEYQKKTTIYENGIYWASMGVNVGSELNKRRPVLVWKKRCGGNDESTFSYIVIPITSKQKNKKYFYNVPIDINGKECYLRLEDMHRISIKRFSKPVLSPDKKILFITQEKRDEINSAIKNFYIFDNDYSFQNSQK